MSAITVGAEQITEWNDRELSVELWIFANQDFVSSDGTQVLSGAIEGDNQIVYLRVPCTVNTTGRTIDIDSFEIQPTVLGQDVQSTIYDSYFVEVKANGRFRKKIRAYRTGFRVGESPALQNWVDIINYQVPQANIFTTTSAFSIDQSDARYALASVVLNAAQVNVVNAWTAVQNYNDSGFRLRGNSRVSTSSIDPTYDQESNVLATLFDIDVGEQEVNSGSSSKQFDILRIAGTLTGNPTGSAHAYLHGLNFNMQVDGDPTGSSDPFAVQARGIVGEFRNNSPTGASVRGMNLHALALEGSTGATNAIACGISPATTTGVDLARAIQITSKQVANKSIGIFFEQDSGKNYKVGIDFSPAVYFAAAMKVASGQNVLAGRNAANNADVPFLTWGSNDQMQVNVPLAILGSDQFFQVGENADGWVFQKVDSDQRFRFFKQGGGGERFAIFSEAHLFIRDVSSTPGTPSGGGFFYVQSGSLRFKGSSGTITILAPA